MTEEQKKFAEQNIKLAYYFANKYLRPGECKETVVANALLGLVKAAKSYDANISKPATYINRCVINEINMGRRSELRMRRYGRMCSLDDIMHVDTSFGEDITLADMLAHKDNTEEKFFYQEFVRDLNISLSKLTNKEKYILIEYVKGRTQNEIATDLNHEQSYISRLKISAYQKIINDMNRKGYTLERGKGRIIKNNLPERPNRRKKEAING